MEGFEERKKQAEPLWSQAHEYIQQVPPIQIFAALAILMLTSVLLLKGWLFKRQKANTILLSGLSGSGKTVLFYQLQDGSAHQGTVTSMEPNEGTFVLHSEQSKKGKLEPVHLVDVPGHSRLRSKLDEFLPEAAGIVFVVDALEFLPNLRAASEYLYDILTKAAVVNKKIPMLILCNKTDKVTAHSKDFIRKQLEKEIDKLCATRSAISTADIANDFTLGVLGEPFSFTQCQNKVTVGEAAGIIGDNRGGTVHQGLCKVLGCFNRFLEFVVFGWAEYCGSIMEILQKRCLKPIKHFKEETLIHVCVVADNLNVIPRTACSGFHYLLLIQKVFVLLTLLLYCIRDI